MLNSPPQRLIKNEVPPRINPAKHAFKTATVKADGNPSAAAANILARLEKPGFAPGGKNAVGNKLSKYESTIAVAAKSPIRAIL